MVKNKPEKHKSIDYSSNSNTKSFFISYTNELEISNIIKNFKKNAVGGIDGISVRVIQALTEYLTITLTLLINKIIFSGICPEHFKRAEIIPIFKNSDKSKKTNYRPISLISNLAKIFEKVLHVRIIQYLEKNSILNSNQFGFRKKISTNDAINSLCSNIYKNLDKSIPTMTIFLDIAKAFDTVDHKQLLKKLENLGIRGLALQLLKSYLTHRKHVVRIDDTTSDELVALRGVPQETLLGPLFFIIYINEMLNLKTNGIILSYADDTAIIINGNTWKSVEEIANNVLNTVVDWLNNNNFSLNVEKSNYILFGNRKTKIPLNLKLIIHSNDNNKTYFVNRVENIKYLGVMIDSNMKWKQHIKNVTQKLRYLIYIFANLKYILNQKTLIKVYYALFESKATYGIIACGAAYNNAVVGMGDISRYLNYR